LNGLTLAPAGLTRSNGAPVTSAEVLNAFVLQESSGRHSFALTGPLAFTNVNVGEQRLMSDGHYYTDDGIGFVQIQPYNSHGLNLYSPTANLQCAARILDTVINSPNNPGTTPQQKIWWGCYIYNAGNWERPAWGGGNTIAQLKAAGGLSALYANQICNTDLQLGV
jgi:hypothetical protein